MYIAWDGSSFLTKDGRLKVDSKLATKFECIKEIIKAAKIRGYYVWVVKLVDDKPTEYCGIWTHDLSYRWKYSISKNSGMALPVL